MNRKNRQGLQIALQACSLLMAGQVMGQESGSWYPQSLLNNRVGMGILGSWAAGNMIIGGIGMTRLASGSLKRADLLSGYGKSVIMQGAFLLVFDLIMWGVQKGIHI